MEGLGECLDVCSWPPLYAKRVHMYQNYGSRPQDHDKYDLLGPISIIAVYVDPLGSYIALPSTLNPYRALRNPSTNPKP